MAPQKSSIKRILVALDGSPASMSALAKSVELAIRLNAELVGLFVEDINLLRASHLSFSREIGFLGGGFRHLDALELERQLRVQAGRARRLMERITRESKLPTMFRVVRGSVAEEILNAGEAADLLVLGKTGRSFPGFRRSGSTVRSVVVRRPGMTLIWHDHGPETRPVVLIYDGGESGEKALEVAVSLQQVQESGLIVYLVADSREKGDELRLEVSARLESLGTHATFRTLVRPDFKNLAWLLGSENAGPVVLPCNEQQISGEHLCSLVEEITNPVLLVK
jgi:nucleotide-binding universal stress UspA family protein